MSKYTDIRDAISSAIAEGDPTCPNIYPYMRVPLDTSADMFYRLFGKNHSSNANGSNNDMIHAWTFRRTGQPSRMNVLQMFGGADEGRTLVETWTLEVFQTMIDPINVPEGETDVPSEHAFQEMLDDVSDALIQNASIKALARSNNCVVDDVSITGIDQFYFGDEFHCHYATVTITFNYPRYVAT